MGEETSLPRPDHCGEQKGAIDMAGSWSRRDTIWTDGSRLECGKMGAACIWKTAGGWDGLCFHLEDNREVFDAEVYAISQVLEVLDRRQESGRRYTIFVDSTSAIDRARSDSIGPGQSFAIAAIEWCSRAIARSNEATARWDPAHHGTMGNEKADEFVGAAAQTAQSQMSCGGRLVYPT